MTIKIKKIIPPSPEQWQAVIKNAINWIDPNHRSDSDICEAWSCEDELCCQTCPQATIEYDFDSYYLVCHKCDEGRLFVIGPKDLKLITDYLRINDLNFNCWFLGNLNCNVEVEEKEKPNYPMYTNSYYELSSIDEEDDKDYCELWKMVIPELPYSDELILGKI